MSHGDSYQLLARHYDAAYASKTNLADAPFYLELTRRFGGPVLEIGCGTGRILLQVARQGLDIDGVDNSASMLRHLKSRLQNEPREVRERVNLYEEDMRSFRLREKYRLAIMPFRPMQHLYSVRDQVNALTTVAVHLQDDGRLAFDVFSPKFELLADGIGREIPDLEWIEEAAPHRTVQRFFRKEWFDKRDQTFGGSFIFRTYEGGELVLEETGPLKMSYYTYPQLQALFLLAGLEPVEEYGSFAKAPIDNQADEMIFVLKKSKQTLP